MVGFAAAPFINVLLQLLMEPKTTTGVCPIRGRPRFFRITIFPSDMR